VDAGDERADEPDVGLAQLAGGNVDDDAADDQNVERRAAEGGIGGPPAQRLDLGRFTHG
jgi:hypothetical protein